MSPHNEDVQGQSILKSITTSLQQIYTNKYISKEQPREIYKTDLQHLHIITQQNKIIQTQIMLQ